MRLLSPGAWNLTFSARGYHDTIINNVSVVSGQRTDLIVDMSLLPDSIKKIASQSPIILYPNPSSSSISALLPDILTGDINVRIISMTGKLMSDYNTETIPGVPLVINIKSLSAGSYTVIFSCFKQRRYFHGRFVVIK